MDSKQSFMSVVFQATLMVAVLLFVVSCRESSPGDTDDSNSADGAAVGTSNDSSQNVPIQFELPTPVFKGTDENIDVPNLEPFQRSLIPRSWHRSELKM